MAPKAKAPNFGSQDYWNQRFTSNTASFDWLSAPEALNPMITEALRTLDERQPHILHIGCGSSLLSQHLRTHVQDSRQVHNVDFSRIVIDAERKRDLESVGEYQNACARWDAVDLLDCRSLINACGHGAYSVIVDKSTSDAISCADDVVCALPYTVSLKGSAANEGIDIEPKEIPVHPLHLMAVHLGLVAKPGARWIALSYSSERYPFLEGEAAMTEDDGTADTGIPEPRLLWKVIDKREIEAEEQGDAGGITHRPKVYHWVYVLQRTAAPLFINSE